MRLAARLLPSGAGGYLWSTSINTGVARWRSRSRVMLAMSRLSAVSISGLMHG